MQRFLFFVAAMSANVLVAFGHGHTINVTAVNNQLVVTGGVAGAANGLASQVFVETDSSGDPQDFATFTNFGPAIYWIVPGFGISGLAENSGLYLQTLARPWQGPCLWRPASIGIGIRTRARPIRLRSPLTEAVCRSGKVPR